MGPRGGLNCDCCRLDVAVFNESEIPEAETATAPASSTAKQAKRDLRAMEVQHVQYLSHPKIPKGHAEDQQASAHGNGKKKVTWHGSKCSKHHEATHFMRDKVVAWNGFRGASVKKRTTLQ
ncbi:uncharacterized protein C22orf42-like isoform X2 [Symphalangus syndactylus]